MLLVRTGWSCIKEILPYSAKVPLDKVGITEAVYVRLSYTSCMQLL